MSCLKAWGSGISGRHLGSIGDRGRHNDRVGCGDGPGPDSGGLLGLGSRWRLFWSPASEFHGLDGNDIDHLPSSRAEAARLALSAGGGLESRTAK